MYRAYVLSSSLAALCLLTPASGQDAPATASPQDLFSQLDVNRDGQLSLDEVPGDRKSLFERLVRVADANSDGQLSAEEFAKGLNPAAATSNDGQQDAPRPSSPNREGKRQMDPARMFKRMDRNGDGKATLDEIPEERREQVKRLFKRGDKDGDGALSQEEVTAAMKAARARAGRPNAGGQPGSQPDPKRLFERMDRNSDGKVTADEVPEQRRANIERLIARADKDGDKALSAEEFAAVAARRPGAPPTKPEPAVAGGKKAKKQVKAQQTAAKKARPAKQQAKKAGVEARPVGLFRLLDSDRDGSLNGGEISAAAESLRKLDKNNDGVISRDEIGGGPKKKAPKADKPQS